MSRECTFADAVGEALAGAMAADDEMLVLGEDVRYGYITDATAGLVDRFGDDRVLNTPIAENSIVGMGVGTAMRGVTTVAEVMFCDVALLAFDQLMNQAVKVPPIFDGQLEVPLVLRMLSGHFAGAFGPQHSKTLTALFTHVPGLKVVVPSTPYQAKGLLATAIDDPGPVAFLEHARLIHRTGAVPETDYALEYADGIEVARDGSDVAIVTSGWLVHEALEAAETLAADGVDAKVVDLAVLDPLPKAALLEAVADVGRIVVADEGYPRCGVAADVAAFLAEEALYDLDAPIQRVNAANTPIPANTEHQQAVIPDRADIVEAAKTLA